EELGLPLSRVRVSAGDSARGPYASISAGSSTIPSMGPAVRAAAADVKRQVIEIAAERDDKAEGNRSRRGRKGGEAQGGSWARARGALPRASPAGPPRRRGGATTRRGAAPRAAGGGARPPAAARGRWKAWTSCPPRSERLRSSLS